jgi:hypothetical protein
MPAKPQRMFDVEFLLTQPYFDVPLVYLYRSGALRTAIKDCLKEVKGELSTCDPGGALGLLAGSSLLPGFNICDWTRENGALPESYMERTLGSLASRGSGECALFLPIDSPLTAHPNWPEVEVASFVVEEPLLSARTLRPILRYLEATTDLADGANFLTQRGFVRNFQDLLEDRKAGLCEAMRAFDQLVLTQTDPETNEFFVRHNVDEGLRGFDRTTLSRQLEELVVTNDPAALVQFIVSLESRCRSRPRAETIVGEIYRWTERLLLTAERALRQPGSNSISASRVARGDLGFSEVLWAALVLVWENRLLEHARSQDFRARRGPDITIVRWEQMGREFLVRTERGDEEDPLAGRWADLRRALMTRRGEDASVPVANRAKVVRSLAHYLSEVPERGRCAWLSKLHGCVMASLSKSAVEGSDSTDRSVS